MKENIIYQPYTKINIKLVLLFLFFSFFVKAQDVKDSLNGYNKGKIEMPNPSSILEAYTYDPVSDRYIYTKTFEGFNIDYPLVLSPQEYEKLVQKESIREYFQKKIDAVDGKKEASKDAKKDLLPKYYINSSFFESIFGSNTIEVKPTGSVEVDLGVRYSKQDNPAFSPRNRRTTTFDFDQRINMSLLGKVGTRLKVTANYDTESTFAFQNLIKLEYTPTEDDIIQKIEVGNVSMPLNSTLIRGAQSLFGVKAQFQFGKTTITGVFSEQKSQTKTVTSQGGGLIQDFNIFGLEYDSDRHFFLSQYFRNKYDKALLTYPIIDSRVQITRMEVWVTNRQNRITTNNDGNNLRNIVALQDLGEAEQTGFLPTDIAAFGATPNFFDATKLDQPSSNENNKLDPAKIGTTGFLNQNIREISIASSGFNTVTGVEGIDFSKLENARKLTQNEYDFHPQLGYISLKQRLNNDEVLAVAYEFTIGDKKYQVGEFANDGVDATQVNSNVPSSQALILKMLKGNLTNVDKPVWNLMMKNIYQIPGAYQLDQSDFKFNIVYTDPSPLNYITPANSTSPLPIDNPATPNINEGVDKTPLLKVFNLDKLNPNNDPQQGGDGFFDFIPGLTVDPQNARIIFTTVEPFGKLLFEKLRTSPLQNYSGDPLTNDYNDNQRKYVYRNLYRKTQAFAQQESEKNKFQLKGKFKSAGGDGISLGATNVPRGSVVVTAGGRVLQEGIDYSVNYQSGRVQILDPSIQASGVPIQVSVENNAVFGQQTRRFMGINVEHKFNDKFQVGATLLKLTERPFTQKTNYGQESVNNLMYGLNTNFSTEVPLFTRLVNKLPNIDTDVPSNLSFRGEVAFLKPGTPKADRFEGQSTVYVDDFEGSQSTIDMRGALAWTLSSVPKDFNGSFGSDDVRYGEKRAKLSWYSIDPLFYDPNRRPAGIDNNSISSHNTRRIEINELFPNTNIAAGESNYTSTLDLSYFPEERGPYNFNSSAVGNTLPSPSSNFGGIQRSITTTNFEQSNVEYIQFWVLDPYFGAAAETNPANVGKLTINLGEISEDILNDGKKSYENGLPTPSSQTPTIPSNWGVTPASQSLIYAFDGNEQNRTAQDVGLDGLNDVVEATKYPAFANTGDPAQDNYQYYLSASGSIVDRYKKYNGTQGNSPVTVSDTNRGSTTNPDVEDINRDNTMNTIDAYYQFTVDIKPNTQVGDPYVVEVRTTDPPLANNATTQARWILYKIPILEATAANIVNGISDFRSIRFMRMFMHGFTQPVTLRFATLDLVRGEWRRYLSSMEPTIDNDPLDDNTGFDVTSVNIEENSTKSPVPYVSPPNVQREQLYNNNTVINQNEQSLLLRVYDKSNPQSGTEGLQGGDARAVFKNVNVDMRQYKRMKMFLHAEALPTPGETNPLQDNQLVGFMRFGNDFTDNFYQIDMDLKVTPKGAASPDIVWPDANQIDIATSWLTSLKSSKLNGLSAINGIPITTDANGISYIPAIAIDPSAKPGMRIGIKGNPNFGFVRTLMMGIKNPSSNSTEYRRGEVWFNELRLSEMDNKGGMAAIASLDTNLADLMNVSATGRMNTIGFGGIEESPNERSREDMHQYDLMTNTNVGKLFPRKWGVVLPVSYGVGEQVITPKYDPLYQDIELKQLLAQTVDEAQKKNIKNRAIDYTKRKSISFIGVKKERVSDKKQHFYDPENLTLSHAFNEVERHNFEIESLIDQQSRSSVDYNYSFKSKAVEPFSKSQFFKKSNYWKLLSEFNFNYLPSSVNFSSNVLRQFNKQEFRQVDVEGIGLDPLYKRNYLFNYNYGINFNLTKALRVNYTANNGNIVRNYLDANRVPINDLTIWDDYFNIGIPNQHAQQLTVNYELPFNKIPVLSFLKSDYTYIGDYSWTRASLAMQEFQASDGKTYNLGNTIQNANSHKLNTTLNMSTLYKYLGFVKSSERAKKSTVVNVQPTAPKPGEKVAPKQKVKENKPNVFVDGLIGFATMVKNVQLNYGQTNGTMLPGFLPGLGFFGSSKPSLGFVFGMQDDVRFEAAKRGWLTNYPEFNQNFTQINSTQVTATANLEPFPDLKIDLSADRLKSDNFSEQFDAVGGVYNSRSPYSFGNYSISTNMIMTAFKSSDEIYSEVFQTFRDNRLIIANRLAEERYGSSIPRYDASLLPTVDASAPIEDLRNPNNVIRKYVISNDGYPEGYGKNNQAVLIPSLLAAYTGVSANKVGFSAFRNIPIPGWNLKYTGLMRYKFFKDKFRRFSIQHAYKSAYTVNSFRSNFEYDKNPIGRDNNGLGNFHNKFLIGNINMTEQFSPLVRLDFEMKNSIKILAEMKKDRTISMSFDNNLLTEMKGLEYVAGLGYRIKDVKIKTRLAGNGLGVIKSDVNLRADFSYRNNKTIVRNLDYDNNQLGGGQNIISTKITGDYTFAKNLTMIFFFDYSFSKAVVSTSFPLTNIRSGFTLRYNFGNN